MLRVIFFVALCFALCNCSGDDNAPSFSYLALGDSYTIGEGVEENERWPVQLSQSLRGQDILLRSPRIIARTGWQTSDLRSAIDEDSNLGTGFDLVSLLIGVNNQFWGRSPENFRPEFESLLLKSIELARGDDERVFVLSIPDYGVTAFGRSRGPQVSEQIDAYNAVCREVCDAYDIPFFDITPLSRLMESDPNLVSPDNLHPSGEMYALWVEQIASEVAALLRN